MRHLILIVGAACLLICSQVACCRIGLPDIDINVPTVEVGEMQDEQESIPLADIESADVEILFGAGDLQVAAGDAETLFSGHFRYNVEEWKPEVTYENGSLTVQQGETSENWGWPDGNAHNEWELELTPAILLTVDLKAGAGEGELDLGGLRLETLNADLGAGDFTVRFDEPNGASMERLTVNTGAASLNMIGIGNASPEHLRIQGGVGEIDLELTGDWSNSADIEVTAGVGSLTLRLPDDVGVRVEVEGGISGVQVSGLDRSGDAYVNDAYGEEELELNIQVTTGVGQITLIEVSSR